MTPQLSADLHAAGLLETQEALWIYGDDGRIVPNVKALFDNGEPLF